MEQDKVNKQVSGKIQLNKRTMRTLSMSEAELIGGAEKPNPKPDPAPGTSSTVCNRKSEVCPPTANLRCCAASGD